MFFLHLDPLTIIVDNRKQKGSCLLTPSASTQTPAHLSSHSPRKQKWRNVRRKLTCRRESNTELNESTIEDLDQIYDKFLSSHLANIVKIQTRLHTRKARGRRYTAEYKQFALTFSDSVHMNFLRKLLFLTTERTLQRITEKIICKPGLGNEALLKTLEMEVRSMLEQDRNCFMYIDEMSLKCNLFYQIGRDEIVGFTDLGKNIKYFSPANHATVFMIRRLHSNWKQPLTYFSVDEAFKSEQ
ncbi:hypothetical protein JTB14_026458 [Gonioctena quinquepunctata]|nr:hypothetical protein JTB14_026458 [Gonioctena quinquepunctata]